ncbi:hypothetical protein [Actomonas aquatica]|uniref:Secreted protein n=1 Tax=Actomonas aquatica TaxID=2866162 RepID=A0ABZ1C2W3_9BACT|nr:hypothetical protein [Opitutus sp. WL0086]WRQ85821.1 hypothetical protein K1X11_013495 [Opitutus sp. WL0086]
MPLYPARRFWSTACACLLFAPSAWSASPPDSDSTKPYRLYIGVDLLVPDPADDDGNNRLPVATLHPREVVIDDTAGTRLPLRDVPAFSWARKPKVSRSPVTISDFAQYKVFSIQRDKAMQALATQNNMNIYAQERAAYEQMKVGEAQRMVGHAAANLNGVRVAQRNGMIVDARSIEAAEAWVERAQDDAAEALDTFADQTIDSAGMISDPTFIDQAQESSNDEGGDVLELTFKLSSPEPIADAYVVVLGAVVMGEQEGIVTFHQSVGAIGPEPRKIKIRKLGFTPGFDITDVKLHVYSHGRELATNLSERAVPMSRDEAREFLLLSHIADHAIETVTPTPVWNLPPTALLAADRPADFDYPVVVNIDADGSIISIHNSETEARAYLAEIHDASELRTKTTPGKSLSASVRVTSEDAGVTLDQTGRLPSRVVAAMRDMFFLPALDLGSPVPGTTKVNLADFFR